MLRVKRKRGSGSEAAARGAPLGAEGSRRRPRTAQGGCGRGRDRAARAREVLRRLARAYPDATTTTLSHKDPFELLAATMLSAHSTDRRVNIVTPALFRRFPDVRALAAAEPAEVEPLIRSCGLFRTKARNLVKAARALLERHAGEVPADRAALEALPGVGRKTASVVLAVAHGEPAIAVDTHVQRVANRLGLACAKAPAKTEAQLEEVIPPAERRAAHHRLIGHGRKVCKALRPRCADCVLRDLCDHYAHLARGAERSGGVGIARPR